MNFFSKFSDAFLFLYVEITFVYSVCHNIVSKLAAAEMMENHAFLPSVDYFAIVCCGEFLSKLSLGSKLFEDSQNFVVNLLCGVVVSETCSHRNAVVFYAVGSACGSKL